MTEPLRIAWMPRYLANATGYGFIAKRMARALRDAGAHLVDRAETTWDWRISVGLPAHYAVGPERQADMIAHTMFECAPLPAAWPAILNKHGAVWVPSRFCADLFRQAGVTVPILTSGYGVDSSYFYPDEGRDWANLGRPLRFGAWGHSFAGRKNLLMAAEAFLAANAPEAEMEIKVTWAYDACGIRNGDGRRIQVRRGAWPVEELAAWLRGIDVMLYLSGGEGFGLQPLEYMATGGALICAANSGMLDYLTPGNSIMLACPVERLDEDYQTRYGPQLFTMRDPHIDDVIAAIRLISEQRDSLPARLGAGALATARSMTWERAATHILGQLRALSQPNTQEHSP